MIVTMIARSPAGIQHVSVSGSRVVYKIEENVVWILGIQHRKTVYEDILERLSERG